LDGISGREAGVGLVQLDTLTRGYSRSFYAPPRTQIILPTSLTTPLPSQQKVPIYYASKTSDKAHRVYETYVNMMNEHVRQQMDVSNPFRFAFIRNLKSVEEVDDMTPCVVMASPGFMSSGPSRRLFDR